MIEVKKRKRKLKPDDKRMSKHIMVCVTPNEHKRLTTAADRRGLTLSAYLRIVLTKRAKNESNHTNDNDQSKATCNVANG